MKKASKGLSLTMILALMLTPALALTSAQADDQTDVLKLLGDSSAPVGQSIDDEETILDLVEDDDAVDEDEGYWVDAFYHDNHWHEGFWSEVKLSGDERLTHLTASAKVYAIPDADAEVLTTLSEGDVVCPIERVGDGWVHVYYNDGKNAGWIYTG